MGKITDTKRPDCFIQRRRKSYPRIVVEVGYSETFNKLIEDAHRWLRRSNLVHRVFLVKIDKEDKYQLFKEAVESKEGKSKLWANYQRLLAGNVSKFPQSAYCGRRSHLYNLLPEELQRYFEERTDMIEELKEKLNAWHEGNFPLLEDIPATLYVYGCPCRRKATRK